MPKLQDLINVGPEETYLTPWDLQQVISKFNGYPDAGGEFTLTNEADEPVLQFIEGSGLFATPDDGSTAPQRVLVDNFHSFVGMIVETAVDPTTLEATWHVCDGTGGTPDLRDRFVVGVGADFSVDDFGGQVEINFGHVHTLAHTHAHTHAASSMVAATHSHGAGDYKAPLHKHQAGTYTQPTHSHGPGDIKLNHDHGLDSHVHDIQHNHQVDTVDGDPSGDVDAQVGGSGTEAAANWDHTHSVDVLRNTQDTDNKTTDDGRKWSDAAVKENVGSDGGHTGTFTSTQSTTSGNWGSTSGQTNPDGDDAITGESGFQTVATQDELVTGTSGSQSSAVSGNTTSDNSNPNATYTGDGEYTAPGVGATTNILPPYYALYRVMRVA